MTRTSTTSNKDEFFEQSFTSSNSDRKVQVTARLTREQFKKVEEIEKELGVSKAEAIRRLIEK